MTTEESAWDLLIWSDGSRPTVTSQMCELLLRGFLPAVDRVPVKIKSDCPHVRKRQSGNGVEAHLFWRKTDTGKQKSEGGQTRELY